MFGLKTLNRRIAALEQRLDVRDQKDECEAGKHAWETVKSWKGDAPPYIRCKACLINANDVVGK